MEHESGEKKELVSTTSSQPKMSRNWVILLLRLLALGGTVSATVVMALNKQKRTVVVGTVGTTPITASVEAKFQHTPAFVFFVIVSSIGSFHNLLMLAVDILAHKLDFKGLRLLIVTLLDTGMIALLSAGLGGAAAMAELGKNGNSHARWDKICDKFGTYCDHGGGALIAAFLGLVFLMMINGLSIVALYKKSAKLSVVCA